MFDVEAKGDGEGEATAARVRRLERHLARIGAEVRAAGILLAEASPAPDGSVPGSAVAGVPPAEPGRVDVSVLTDRQREVLGRLLAGQRVPAIARDLVVSQATVRNHLSAVFGKLGVGSQSELIELFRPGGRDMGDG